MKYIFKLEALLHHFYVTYKPAVAGMNAWSHCSLLSNMSCVAAEAFITCKKSADIGAKLIEATRGYHDQVADFVTKNGLKSPCEYKAKAEWIDFAAVAATALAPPKQACTLRSPRCCRR